MPLPKKILVIGATGFIAAQIVTDLLAAGHDVVCCVRDVAYARNIFPKAQVLECNFYQDTQEQVWLPRLEGVDVVINCVGILYHPDPQKIWKVHFETPKAIFDAAVQCGVKKIFQISALGADQVAVAYAESKKACDDYLLSLPLEAIILRPSLVYGRGSYGGTSLFRALASLPWVIPVPGNGEQSFQPIYIEDLSAAIVQLINKSIGQSIVLDAVGPARIHMKELLPKLRRWLGFAKAKQFFIPLLCIRIGAFFGNLIPYSTLNKTAYQMMIHNNVSTDEATLKFQQIIGFVPRDFMTGLYEQPSTVQDRWHARLFFLKPLLSLSIAFVWIWTGLCSAFFYPHQEAYLLLQQVGINGMFAPVALYGASLVDVVLGGALLAQYRTKLVCQIQLLLMVAYTVLISWKLPMLWLDTFAPIAKNVPLIVAILIYLALESDR